MSAEEARAVLALYDQRTGNVPETKSKKKAAVPEPVEHLRVAELAETLRLPENEIQQLLQHVRAGADASQHRQEVSTLRNAVTNLQYGAYGPVFQSFDDYGGAFKATWNWAAFLFGPLWYFSKGLWAKGLLFLLLDSLTGGIVHFIAAMFANYDYYLLARKGTQLYDGAKFGGPGVLPPPPIVAPPPPRTETPPAPPRLDEKIKVLRETYERGLIRQDEYERKREAFLRETEYQGSLAQLDQALAAGVLTPAEHAEKRRLLLDPDASV
jgi:hypothetical protein